MKNQSTILYLLVLLFTAQVHAQNTPPVNEPDYNKPLLFSSLPTRIAVNMDNLTRSMTNTAGQTVSMNLSSDATVTFSGNVVSNESMYDNALQTVVIRSSNFSGAVLSFSRVRLDDGTSRYTGRIVSLQHGDLYELVQENNTFYFIKRNYYDLINE